MKNAFVDHAIDERGRLGQEHASLFQVLRCQSLPHPLDLAAEPGTVGTIPLPPLFVLSNSLQC